MTFMFNALFCRPLSFSRDKPFRREKYNVDGDIRLVKKICSCSCVMDTECGVTCMHSLLCVPVWCQ
jgi:hypothetical protein